MLPRLFCLLPLLFACSFAALAQVFEPGLLVRANGDTLRGEIENGFWVESPEFIRYRPAAGAPAKLFQPRQLRTVVFTGGRKFSYEALPFDHAAKTGLNDLPRSNYYDVRVDTLLAEVLLEGPVPLRRVVWNTITHYLLRRPNHPVLDLSERRYLRETDVGTLAITDGNNFRNQLTLYFGDCPAAVALTRTMPFTADGIVELVQQFNQACGPERQRTRSWVAEAAPRRRVAFQGGILAGARYNRIEGNYKLPTKPCVDCRPRPFAGLYAELYQPSRTTAVYGELGLSQFRSEGRALVNFSQATGPVFSTYEYRGLLGTARLGLRYFFPVHRKHQWLLGFAVELNRIYNPTYAPISGPPYRPYTEELGYAKTTLLPGIMLGWRRGRFTASADVQTYASSDRDGLSSVFFGSNFALRTSLSYRLGGNPDEADAHISKR